MSGHLYRQLGGASTTYTAPTTQPATHVSQGQQRVSVDTSCGSVRSQLLSESRAALEQQIDSLELSIGKVREKPSLSGIRFLRESKELIESKVVGMSNLLNEVLGEQEDVTARASIRAEGLVRQAGVARRLGAVEEALRACEQAALDKDGSQPSQPGSKNHAFVERLPLPKFKGDPLEYPDFRSLFRELVNGLTIPESATLEYLRKSLPESLVFLVKGSKTMNEAWSRLDERFSDRVGAIARIL